jgi:hypothetical protein
MISNLDWIDLKYFYNTSWHAFYTLEIFITDKLRYAVFKNLEDKNEYIVWPNDLRRYRELEMCKAREKITQANEFRDITKSQFRFVGVPTENIQHAKMIVANQAVSVALMQDGSLHSWGFFGFPNFFGNNNLYGQQIPENVENAKAIFSTNSAFAAILNNGNLEGWGDMLMGANIPMELQMNFRTQVKMIFSTDFGFTALLDDYTLIQWGQTGGPFFVYKIPTILQGNTNIKKIISNRLAFAALLNDGSLLAWGIGQSANIPETIQLKLHKNVKFLLKTNHAFAALLHDGSVVSWGEDINFPTIELVNVKKLVSTDSDFMALFQDGNVITWGRYTFGNEYEPIGNEYEPIGRKVKDIFSTSKRFGVLLENESSLIIWLQFGIDHGYARTELWSFGSKGPIHGLFADENSFTALFGPHNDLQEKCFKDPE